MKSIVSSKTVIGSPENRMDDTPYNPEDNDVFSNDTESEKDFELWEDLNGRELSSLLNQFMRWYRLSDNDVVTYAEIKRSTVRSAIDYGEFTPAHVNKLLAQVQQHREIMSSDYHTWHKALSLAAYILHQRYTARERQWDFSDAKVMKNLYQALAQAYDETTGVPVELILSLPRFAEIWENEWGWIRVPKSYRVTRVEKNRYDLESTLPFAIELGKIRTLGSGLRVERKGWGTGAYRVYRRSTASLGEPLDFEPVLVHIPAGEFWMGKPETDSGVEYHAESSHAEPFHKAYLDEYWIGRYPVTVAEFAVFVDHYGYTTSVEEQHGSDWINWRMPYYLGDKNTHNYSRHPVTHVSVSDAQAYCRWLSQVTGKRYSLPSEAEWEKAARGTDARIYPWGNSAPNRTLCNIEHWFGSTDTVSITPVGQFSPAGDGPTFDNPYGCADMAGTVREWTLGTRTLQIPYNPFQDEEPIYYRQKTEKVVCGGSWRENQKYARCASRQFGFNPGVDTGFRVVVHPSSTTH
jgi:formylglycine-generating enzyme required for sulfatase activity